MKSISCSLLCWLFALCLLAAGDRFPSAADFATREELLDAYYDLLEPLPFDYRHLGSVLEGLARARFALDRYPPPAHQILSGVEYFSSGGRTIGELDLLVWDEAEQRIIEVYEVKISGNLDRARGQAEEQIQRFRKSLDQGAVRRFRVRIGEQRRLTPGNFDGEVTYGIIGGAGSSDQGWTLEIDLRREEADLLQARLLLRK